jgi:glucose-1-phosphate thymidylyltransferase
MKALILAAGYATRLYPLTKEYPKPLLKLGEKRIIDYIVEKLQNLEGLDEIIVVTNSRFISLFREWAKKIRIKVRLSIIDDLTKGLAERRGAIGDIDFVINDKQLKDDLLVIGGDNIFQDSLDKFLSFVKSKKVEPVIGAYNVGGLEKARHYGVIELNNRDKVVDFQEKPRIPKSTLVATCLYYFPKEKLRLIKEYVNSKTNGADATGLYIDWLSKKTPVYGFVFNKEWFDIGELKFYNEAKQAYLNRRRRS